MIEDREIGIRVPTKEELVELAASILQSPVDPEKKLVSQGLDSLGASELLEVLHQRGLDVDYEFLLSQASIDSLLEVLHAKVEDGPRLSPQEWAYAPFSLTGPQEIWAGLEDQGWGSWANISLCLSIPASVIRATYLPAIVQSLCDANDAMRMVLVKSQDDGAKVRQRRVPDFQIPVHVRDAPDAKRDAMRLIEAFEGEECTPFSPSTRALVLSSPNNNGRHWLCITMHHVFADRISMQNLERQFRDILSRGALEFDQSQVVAFSDVARWQTDKLDQAEGQHCQALRALLGGTDVSANRQKLRLCENLSTGSADSPTKAHFSYAQVKALEAHASELETTLPLFIHAVYSALLPQLTGDDKSLRGEEDLLLCQVVSNRERHTTLKHLVGCMDTSVPVAVSLSGDETLASLCKKTQKSFVAAHRCIADLPRGGWLDASEATLFERVPHINIVRAAPSSPSENAPLNIQEHSVDRVQKTRWGLLLRVALPLSEGNADANDSAQEMTIRAFAEDRELAGLASQCLADVLHAILAEPVQTAGELRILETVERIVEHARFAVDQIRQASAMMSNEYKADAFIYDKLIARQQRWFAHNAQHELCRDASNRFVGTVANPFPFTQLDKLKERRFLEERGIPLPKMLHVIPKENLRKNLIKLAPSLPPHFAIKPVGAGHSFGVTLVRDNLNLSQDGIPFDAKSVAAKLHDMAEQGHCIHAGNAFPFNFSSFLIEELVLDEKGFAIPTDYKVFMIGKTFLWLQLHFKKDDVNWVAFVDADFKLLPEPAWDPATCWQTHKALVCIDQREIDARKPKCLPDILNHSHRLASDMDIFVRLDWYSDKNHGALMGEITTFPHMLQPRSFYTPWANKLVKSLWQDPDGVALKTADVTGPYISDPIAQAEVLINEVGAKTPHLEDFIPKTSKALWAVEENVTFKALHAYVSGFDLARFGTSHGERVGLLVANGAQLGALLLATMNRYIAVPIGSTLPASLIAAQVENCAIKTLVVVGGSDEAKKAQDIARDNCGLTLVELAPNSFFALAELPPEAPVGPAARSTAKNGLDDDVLLLQSSGSTGDPKRVAFTLSRLMRSGTMIAKSLDLSPADQGVSMLPLHHIAGIACNLVAPLLSSGSMRFERSFDPKLYITALSGPTGATWSFLVPSMWALLTEYAKSHPELKATRPWPRLRLLRSAGSELSHDTAKELSALFGDTVAVLPTYGMTEAMPIASPCSTYHLKCPGSVGQVLPDVSVEIIDTDHGSFLSVADGIVGEITVKGATVIESYDGAEHTPSSTFTARGYFRTGDLGAFAADGSKWLSIKGRIKDVINVGGETIAPADVEAVLRNCPVFADQAAHVQIMAFARPHSDLGECVAIAIVGADADLDVTRVHAWAEKHLSPAMVPVSFVLLSKFPQTETGKLKRAQFAEQFNAHHSATKLGTLQTYSWLAHETSPKLCTENTTECQRSQVTTHSVTLDQVVAVIQGQVKSQTEIGPDTRLDDAGVNSLAAVHLSNALNDYFQVDLPTWAISDHPTPRALFAWIENSKSGGISVSRDIKTMSAPRKITQPNGSTLRMLFLHGEAADAELMEMSLQATQWSGRLKDKLDFVCVNAPHARKPAPEFHTAALDAGLYEKSEYKSWGVSDPELLEQSISNVLDTLEGHGTINAIGGICDGALVASIVASRRPELKLLLCMSPSPVSRLASQFSDADWPVPCQSIQFVSAQDELHSFAQQLEIARYCSKTHLLQHDEGHAVPKLDRALQNEIGYVLDGLGKNAAGPSSVQITETKTYDTLGETVRNAQAAKQLEPIVHKAFNRILGLEAIDRKSDFFDMGGNSLKALRLSQQLEKDTGVDLPFETLFMEGANVESLTRCIAKWQNSSRHTFSIQLNTPMSGETFFALPALNGHLSDYVALGEALKGLANLVGIRPDILSSKPWNASVSLVDLANEAAKIIRNQTHSNKINLVGFSAAGVVAFETAKFLQDWGFDIGCLAIIDSDATSDGNGWPVPVKYLCEWQKDISRRLRGRDNQRKSFAQLHFRAGLARWAPTPIAIDTPIFFKTECGTIDEEQITKWRKACGDTFRIVPISGGHTSLRTPKIADQIAQNLLSRASPNTRTRATLSCKTLARL